MSNVAPGRSLIMRRGLVTFLKTIKPPDFNNDVKKVSTKFFDINALSSPGDFPAISVLMGPWSRVPVDESTVLKRTVATYAIVGFVSCGPDDRDEGKLDDAVDSLDQDISNVIELNTQTLLNLDAEELNVTAGDSFFSYKELLARFSIYLEVQFSHDPYI